MTQYDITTRITPHLDQHMVIPVLDWLQENKFYKNEDVIQAKIDLVNNTKMLDYAAQEHEVLHGSKPADLEANKAAVFAELTAIQDSIGPMAQFVQNNSAIEELRANHNWTIEHLAREYQITTAHVQQYFVFAKATFDCGSYKDAGTTDTTASKQ